MSCHSDSNPNLPLRRLQVATPSPLSCVNSVITRFHARSPAIDFRVVLHNTTESRSGVGSGSSRSWHRISVAPRSPLSVPIRADDQTGKYRIREEGRDRHLNRAHSLPSSLPCAVPPARRPDPIRRSMERATGEEIEGCEIQNSGFFQVPHGGLEMAWDQKHLPSHEYCCQHRTLTHATHGSKILFLIEERLMRGEFLSPHSSANRVCRPPPSLRHRSSHVSLSFFPPTIHSYMNDTCKGWSDRS